MYLKSILNTLKVFEYLYSTTIEVGKSLIRYNIYLNEIVRLGRRRFRLMIDERSSDRMIRTAVNVAAERAFVLRLFVEFERGVRTNFVHVVLKMNKKQTHCKYGRLCLNGRLRDLPVESVLNVTESQLRVCCD